jgi:hypothetical protein
MPTAMTPDEQALADIYGAPVYEVSARWESPFQPWIDAQTSPVVSWWAWHRATDTCTPIYERYPDGQKD